MKASLMRIFSLIIILVLGTVLVVSAAGPQVKPAQDTNLDAILAEATVKGLLNSLKYSASSRTNLVNFYLVDDIEDGAIASELGNTQLDSYEIDNGTWLDDETYQVTASLVPLNRVLVADVKKVGVRWQVVNLAWGSGSTNTNTNTASTTADSSGVTGGLPVGERPIAEVKSPELNIRSGPGLNYPIQGRLSLGDEVEVIGISGKRTWYYVAQNGQNIGWISAWSQVISLSPADAEVPFVGAPSLPSGASVSSASGSFGTAGGKLILQSKSGGEFYLVNADGSNLRPVSYGIDPALSPDGTRVAFTRWGSGEVGSLWIHDLTTGQAWSILGEMFEPKAPTWSPDGSKIMISFQHGGRREGVSSRTCHGQTIPRGAYDISGVFEDGQVKYCYKLLPDTHWQLRLVDVATGNYQDMASETYSYAPTWDPVNTWRVVFAGSTGLLQLDINRNTYFPFGANLDFRDHGPVFSPDGKTVAVSYRQHQHWEIYTVDATSGQHTRLTTQSVLADSYYNNAAPAWSPDSRQIAFVSDRNGKWEFWVMNADGSNQRLLLPADVMAQIPLEYNNVDERLISWGQ